MAFAAYKTVQITAPNGSTSNLLTLCRAVDSSFPGSCHELLISGDKTNTNKVSVGDADTGASRYGYQLEGGESRTYRSDSGTIPLSLIYVRGEAASQKINVEALW